MLPWVVAACIALLGARAQGQSASLEFWPEVQIVHKFDDRTKFMGTVDTSRERNSDQAYSGGAVVALDHSFSEILSARVGYRHVQALDGSSFVEDRLLVEQNIRASLPAGVKLDFRTREDFRWLNSGFSVRLRERVQISRGMNIGDYTFTPYASAEAYFDTRYNQIARYRVIAGTSFPIGNWLEVSPYFAHQIDVVPASTIVKAIGLSVAISY